HPSVGSFSDTDIEAACLLGLKKTIVVDEKYRYTMQPANENVFSPDMWKNIKNSFNETYLKVRGELSFARSKGQISEQNFEEMLDHMTWQRSTKSCGLKYTREKYIPHSDNYVIDNI
ncbi:MAG: hypothetical protein PHV68_03040, partial [Candidatus Gastranaerophilales bacterium]|nr:hypothetical protein [Candidatus Gastranaerophilales bacterium]